MVQDLNLMGVAKIQVHEMPIDRLIGFRIVMFDNLPFSAEIGVAQWLNHSREIFATVGKITLNLEPPKNLDAILNF